MARPEHGERGPGDTTVATGTPARVWFTVVTVVALGLVVAGLLLHASASTSPQAWHIRWWMLAVAFAVAEALVVHLHFRRSALSFTFIEVPLVAGMFFSSPMEVLLAQCIGLVVMFARHRSSRPVRVLFNLGQYLVSTGAALLLFGLLVPEADPLSPRAWVAAGLAALVQSAVSASLIGAVVLASEGSLPLRQFLLGHVAGLVVTASNTALALLLVVVATAEPWALLFGIVPTGVVFLSYRAYAAERAQREDLELLHEATRAMRDAPTVRAGLRWFLDRSLRHFRAERVAMVEFAAQGTIVHLLAEDGHLHEGAPLEQGIAGEFRGAVASGAAILGPDLVRAAPLPPGVASRTAMVVPISGESGPLGALVVGDRAGLDAGFTRRELRLLEALAGHTALSLQVDELQQHRHRLGEERDQLRHRALHDPLTGLGNRAMFQERLATAINGGAASVLFCDLDGFKPINDTHGHGVGDQVLTVLAARLRGCVRPGDTVARIGGDEFAVVLSGADATQATEVAARVVEVLQQPVVLRDLRPFRLGVSVGVAVADDGEASHRLMDRADQAMYEAKRAGKGRYVLWTAAT